MCAEAEALGLDIERQDAIRAASRQEQERLHLRVAPRKASQRQGADMRHCLELKRGREIIRCAECGRKR